MGMGTRLGFGRPGALRASREYSKWLTPLTDGSVTFQQTVSLMSAYARARNAYTPDGILTAVSNSSALTVGEDVATKHAT